MKPPYLENGATYCDNGNGERICTGSMMGRRTIIPDAYNGERLHLRRVPFVDGAYDPGGAYWGAPSNLWCAWGETSTGQIQVFVRASDRQEAKTAVALAMRYTTKVIPRFLS